MAADKPPPAELTKVCSACSSLFPRTAEYFGLERRNLDGLAGKCRQCLTDQYRPTRRAWDAANRGRINKRKREKRLENADRERSYHRKYGQRPEVRAKKIARCAEYRNKNLASIRAARAEWKKRNRDKERIYNARRREGWITRSVKSAVIGDLLREQGGRCRWCDADLGDDYHLDHVKPLSRGGTNDRENLALACPPCNVSKGAKLLEEWRPELAV